MIYIIDGFNLFYKIDELKSSSNPHQDLITYIKRNQLTGSLKNKVIIVFDGYTQKECLNSYNFEILFSFQESADAVIKKLVDKFLNKNEVAVVSDDREIRDFMRNKKVAIIRTTEFLRKRQKTNSKSLDKDISYSLQRQITEQLKKIWLEKDNS